MNINLFKVHNFIYRRDVVVQAKENMFGYYLVETKEENDVDDNEADA